MELRSSYDDIITKHSTIRKIGIDWMYMIGNQQQSESLGSMVHGILNLKGPCSLFFTKTTEMS